MWDLCYLAIKLDLTINVDIQIHATDNVWKWDGLQAHACWVHIYVCSFLSPTLYINQWKQKCIYVLTE